MHDDTLAMADLLRRLRLWHEGILCGDEADPASTGAAVTALRFVLDPRTGQPVAPVPASVLGLTSVAIFTPDDAHENPDALKIHAVPTPIDPDQHEACDRHMAYFGKSPGPRWALFHVESVQRLETVLDGDMVRLANPLRKDEGALCKLGNSMPDELARACERITGTRPEAPLMVGADPWGVDVRARFGVIRLEFVEPVSTREEASLAIEGILCERRAG